MANFSKFDTIYATVTKPEGDFICDDKTNLERFMWEMTHDVSILSILRCVILQVNCLTSSHVVIISGLDQIINYTIIHNCYFEICTCFFITYLLTKY
jgi:hypothetical protein